MTLRNLYYNYTGYPNYFDDGGIVYIQDNNGFVRPDSVQTINGNYTSGINPQNTVLNDYQLNQVKKAEEKQTSREKAQNFIDNMNGGGASGWNAIGPAASNIASAFLDTESDLADRTAAAMGMPALANIWKADWKKGNEALTDYRNKLNNIKKNSFIQDANSSWGAANAVKLNSKPIAPITPQSQLLTWKDFRGNMFMKGAGAVAQGAASGSVGGPWGALGGVITGLFGSLFGGIGARKRAKSAYNSYLNKWQTLNSANQAAFNKAVTDQTLSNMQALANGNLQQRISDMSNIRAFGGNLYPIGGTINEGYEEVSQEPVYEGGELPEIIVNAESMPWYKRIWDTYKRNIINPLIQLPRRLTSIEAQYADSYDSNDYTFNEAYADARSKGQKTFFWDNNYYNTDYEGTHGRQYKQDITSGKATTWEQQYPNFTNPELRKEKQEELDTYGITNEQTRNKTPLDYLLQRIPASGYDLNDAISGIKGEFTTRNNYDTPEALTSALKKKYPDLKNTHIPIKESGDIGNVVRPESISDEDWSLFENDVMKWNMYRSNNPEFHKGEYNYLLGFPNKTNRDYAGNLKISSYKTGRLPYYYTSSRLEESEPFIGESGLFNKYTQEFDNTKKRIEELESKLSYPNKEEWIRKKQNGVIDEDEADADARDAEINKKYNTELDKLYGDIYAKQDDFINKYYDDSEFREYWENNGIFINEGDLDYIDWGKVKRLPKKDLELLGSIGYLSNTPKFPILTRGNYLAKSSPTNYYQEEDDGGVYDKGKYTNYINFIKNITGKKPDSNKYDSSNIDLTPLVNAGHLGTYTLGIPENNQYISIYDKFDINPFGSGNDEPIVEIGNPYEYYTRFYRNEEPDIDNLYKNLSNTKAMGGNLYTDLSPNMMNLWNNKQQIDQQKVMNQQLSLGLGNSFNQKMFRAGGPVDPPRSDVSTTAVNNTPDTTNIQIDPYTQALLNGYTPFEYVNANTQAQIEQARQNANAAIKNTVNTIYGDRFGEADYNNQYAQGGNIEYPQGAQYYANGGTHEENPYGGIQVGVDQQGNPNLVEEGEFRWGDYIFSDRISVDPTLLSRYNLAPATKHQGKKANKGKLSYADMAKKYAKKNKELENDPIGKNTLEAYMKRLQDAQEDQKFQDSMEQQKQDAINQYRKTLSTPTQGNPMYGAMKYNGMGNAATQAGVNAGMSDLGQQGSGNEVLSNTNRSGNNMLHAMGGNLYPIGGWLGRLFGRTQRNQQPSKNEWGINKSPDNVWGHEPTFEQRWEHPAIYMPNMPEYLNESLQNIGLGTYDGHVPMYDYIYTPAYGKGSNDLYGNYVKNQYLRNKYLLDMSSQEDTSNAFALQAQGKSVDGSTSNADYTTGYNGATDTIANRSSLTGNINSGNTTTGTYATNAFKEDREGIPLYNTAGKFATFGKGLTPMLYDWMNKTNFKYDPNQRPANELVDMGNNSTFLRTADTVGGYRAPNLMDAERMNNAAQAQGLAALQAALSAGNGNRGFAAAQAAQNAYNTQMGIGNNYATVQQANNAERLQTDQFNNSINIANQNAINAMRQDNQKAEQLGQQMALNAKQAANDYLQKENWYADKTNRIAMDNKATNQAVWTDNALNYFITQAQENAERNRQNNDITKRYWSDKDGVMHYIGDSGLNGKIREYFRKNNIDNGTFTGDRLAAFNSIIQNNKAKDVANEKGELWSTVQGLMDDEIAARNKEVADAKKNEADELQEYRDQFDSELAQLGRYAANKDVYGNYWTSSGDLDYYGKEGFRDSQSLSQLKRAIEMLRTHNDRYNKWTP